MFQGIVLLEKLFLYSVSPFLQHIFNCFFLSFYLLKNRFIASTTYLFYPIVISITILFFIWPFMLNYIGYRLVPSTKSLKYSSYFICFSYIMLTLSIDLLCYDTNNSFPFAYIFFISTLLLVIHTDFRTMLISRFTSVYLTPIGWIISYLGYVPLSTFESISASIIGYISFYVIKSVFYNIKKEDGLGQGDLDLIAMIGSFIGFAGIWFSVLLGSLIGTSISLCSMIISRTHIKKIALGAYISIGAIIYTLFQSQIIRFFSV